MLVSGGGKQMGLIPSLLNGRQNTLDFYFLSFIYFSSNVALA